jgi:hypothetical protein
MQMQAYAEPKLTDKEGRAAPFDTNFCMSCGWLNAPFNALLRAWR